MRDSSALTLHALSCDAWMSASVAELILFFLLCNFDMSEVR